MTFELGVILLAVILAIAAIPVVHRIVAGPTILDRAVASDMLAVLLVMAMALYTAWSRTVYASAAMLSMTALAFLSTVAIARFVAREDASTGSAHDEADRGGPDTDATDAAGHEAIGAPGEGVQRDRPEDEDASGEVGTEVPLRGDAPATPSEEVRDDDH